MASSSTTSTATASWSTPRRPPLQPEVSRRSHPAGILDEHMFAQLTLGMTEALDVEGPLQHFHPAVRTWFARRFPEGPTPAQEAGWGRIAAGEDTLIAAPTGSGKTLAGFLVCIDHLYRAAERGEDVSGQTQVVY